MKQYWLPLGTRVLIKPSSELSDQGDGVGATASGVLLPMSAQQSPITGIIISVGEDCKILAAGDVVLFLRFQGNILTLDNGSSYLAMDEGDVIAVVREAPDDALVLSAGGKPRGADYSRAKAEQKAKARAGIR